MRLTEQEYDTQVVAAEPEVFDFPISDHADKQTRNELVDEMLAHFPFDPAPAVTNWDRNLSYPRKGEDYNYHTNLYRQVVNDNNDSVRLSWIQAMDLAYVAGELGYGDLKETLESFAESEFDESLI